MTPAGGRPVVTVYSRRRCGLCREAEAVVAGVARRRADVRVVDVDSDDALVARYTVRVPVVTVDGVEVAEYHVDPRGLRAALRAARRRRRSAGADAAGRRFVSTLVKSRRGRA